MTTTAKCIECGTFLYIPDDKDNMLCTCGRTVIKPNYKEIFDVYTKYVELLDRYGANPTRGQKAALTRRWHIFVEKCIKNDVNPNRYSYSEAQP